MPSFKANAVEKDFLEKSQNFEAIWMSSRSWLSRNVTGRGKLAQRRDLIDAIEANIKAAYDAMPSDVGATLSEREALIMHSKLAIAQKTALVNLEKLISELEKDYLAKGKNINKSHLYQELVSLKGQLQTYSQGHELSYQMTQSKLMADRNSRVTPYDAEIESISRDPKSGKKYAFLVDRGQNVMGFGGGGLLPYQQEIKDQYTELQAKKNQYVRVAEEFEPYPDAYSYGRATNAQMYQQFIAAQSEQSKAFQVKGKQLGVELLGARRAVEASHANALSETNLKDIQRVVNKTQTEIVLAQYLEYDDPKTSVDAVKMGILLDGLRRIDERNPTTQQELMVRGQLIEALSRISFMDADGVVVLASQVYQQPDWVQFADEAYKSYDAALSNPYNTQAILKASGVVARPKVNPIQSPLIPGDYFQPASPASTTSSGWSSSPELDDDYFGSVSRSSSPPPPPPPPARLNAAAVQNMMRQQGYEMDQPPQYRPPPPPKLYGFGDERNQVYAFSEATWQTAEDQWWAKAGIVCKQLETISELDYSSLSQDDQQAYNEIINESFELGLIDYDETHGNYYTDTYNQYKDEAVAHVEKHGAEIQQFIPGQRHQI